MPFEFDLVRVAAITPPVHVGAPEKNVDEMLRLVSDVDADIVVFPELAITGYTCGDLFATAGVLDGATRALIRMATACRRGVWVVGMPVRVVDRLMNVAAIITGGELRGVVPKSYLPNYREFYEARHFQAAGDADPPELTIGEQTVPFGTDLIFELGPARIGVELCEDFWTPVPPSSHAAMAGANVLVNLSASNETIGKADWRRDLVRSQSGRCIAAYVYCSAGPGESTSDLVFGGHNLIAENGSILAEERAIGDGGPLDLDGTVVVADLDLGRLGHDRMVIGSFDDAASEHHRSFRRIDLWAAADDGTLGSVRDTLIRRVDATPFVPKDERELDRRCAEIFDLQTAGLVKRLRRLPHDLKLSIGISGGLDSTLALLVGVRACDAIGKPRTDILGITMPGFGTTDHTKTSSLQLMRETGITSETIDIRQMCLDVFREMGHDPLGIEIREDTNVDGLQSALNVTPDDAKDLTFENVQARMRTLLLMTRGFVLGTGDMSELALGWCTYNADHMSMYNVNTSIPKTLVRFLVRYAADHHFDGPMRDTLHRVADTPISPELLPPTADGKIRQNTEDSIGSYELHDFFLYHFVRNGFDGPKVLHLAKFAEFESTSDAQEIARTWEMFERRFYANQFKRNCVPDGPKVGSVSLSPRGDWRMPSDAERPTS